MTLIYIFFSTEICSTNKKTTQHSLLRAPNKSNPSRCSFHTHTCLPQAFPGHTRARENSHGCFHKPTSSSSPTSKSHASPDPPGFSPLSEPRSWADGQLGDEPQARLNRSAARLWRGGGKEAGKPRAPHAGRTPPSGTPPPALCERAPGRSGPGQPAGPVRPPSRGLLPPRPPHKARGASPCGARGRG